MTRFDMDNTMSLLDVLDHNEMINANEIALEKKRKIDKEKRQTK